MAEYIGTINFIHRKLLSLHFIKVLLALIDATVLFQSVLSRFTKK